MKTEKQKKVKISITIDNELLKKLDEKTSNRSNYIEYVLKFYYHTIGEDVSKIII
jgi:metal-responsive CopG/Arc/MetJ family transcriptional regulator